MKQILTGQRVWTVLALSLVLLALDIPAEAQAYRDICFRRCRANLTLCNDSSLPPLNGGSANGTCSNNCVDNYLSCDAACDTAANTATCRQQCNTTLGSCSNGCSQSTGSCNDGYASCRRRCEGIPDCTTGAMCPSGTCTSGKCVPSCTSNARCRTLLGTGAICVKKAGHRIGGCFLAFHREIDRNDRNSVVAMFLHSVEWDWSDLYETDRGA